MGNYEENYEIDVQKDTNRFIGTVYYKKNYTTKKFTGNSKEEVLEKISSHMQYLDKKYIEKYNKLREDTRNDLYKKSLSYSVDWLKLKKRKEILWQRESKNILYNDYGKPVYYLDAKGSKSFFAPNKLVLTVHSLLKSQAKNELKKNYEISLERYMSFEDERKKWEDEYHKYIDNIAFDYNNNKEYAVELYYTIFLHNIKFTIDKQINIKENILNFNVENDSVTFNIENGILTINYILPHLNQIWNLIYDKEIEELGVYRYVTSSRINDRVYYNIIFTFVSHIFLNDKESNIISSIYFIGNNPNKNQSNIELIIDKKEYFSARADQINLSDFSSKFNRNKVLFQYLECEGINISNSSRDGRKIVIKETKIDEKILNILSQFNELESLSLINNDLNEIPIALYNFSNLKELYIHSNNLKNISNKIENLKLLEILSLEDNNISEVPNYIFNLKKLRELNFSNNKIEDISIKNLEKLIHFKKCNLKNNQILRNISDDALIDRDIIIKLIGLKKDRHIASKKKILPIEKESNQINNIPLIITEGKTDWKHLKKALERFKDRGEYLDLDIKFKEYENISMSDSQLDDYAQSHAKKINERKIICIFDRDLSDRVKEYGQSEFVHVKNKQFMNTIKGKFKKEYGENSKKYLELEKKLDSFQYEEIDKEFGDILTGKEYREWEIQLKNNVYAFCIPKLSDELDEICIEFYYKEKDLKKEDTDGKRLFTADEFEFKEKVNNCNRFISKCGKFKTDTQSGNDKSTKHITLQYPNNKNDYGYVYKIEEKECNKSNNMNLSKNDFAKNIINDVKGFDNFDIENFRLIFDVIERIVND